MGLVKQSFSCALLLGLLLISGSCVFDGDSSSNWNIPEDDIVSGGPPKDGIPSLFNPAVVPADQATYLGDDDLVVGFVVDGQARAYPHTILDWHEVVNEEFSGGKVLTVSYCPLTGTAIVFDGRHADGNLTFGVSGLLYQNNLIMFDRQTDSHWPQMRLQCDEGPLRDRKLSVYPSIETTWGTWKRLYPNTVILSENTGHDRPYDRPGSAYPGYNIPNSGWLFPMDFRDRRLPNKKRVHGVIFGDQPEDFVTKVYVIELFPRSRLIHDSIDRHPILVIDTGSRNFMISFIREIDEMTLTFELEDESSEFPFTFKDKETGSTWNVLGEAVAGPLAGKKLERTLSYNAYWFAWGVFHPGAEIYEEQVGS